MSPRWFRVFPAVWWALVSWSARCPVAPPPLSRPVEPAPAASTESRENSPQPADTEYRALSAWPPAARKRVVLLPHSQIEPTDTRPTTATPAEPPT
ncbi:MAG: hypothetical protein ACRDSM_11680 [Pseudonocardiaceae bacterium]